MAPRPMSTPRWTSRAFSYPNVDRRRLGGWQGDVHGKTYPDLRPEAPHRGFALSQGPVCSNSPHTAALRHTERLAVRRRCR